MAAQQHSPSILRALCSSGLPRLLHMQLTLSGASQQTCTLGIDGPQQPVQQLQQLQQQQHQRTFSSSSSPSGGSSTDKISGKPFADEKRAALKRARGYPAYKARLPRVRRYGPELRDIDPAAFERMRLVVGYYDLPQNRAKPRPPPPSHVTINNLQTIMFTDAVDPYYKLALLSYRSKLTNAELIKGLSKTRAFLQQLSAPPDFVPANLDTLTGAQQQQQQQEQQQQGAEAKAAE